MIRLALPLDEPEVLRRANEPVTGVICAMHWQMQTQNPRLPHQFFLAGAQGLLKISGGRALLCGPAEDAEEIGAFLRFSGVSQLTALDLLLPSWQLAEENKVLLRPPSPAQTSATVPSGFTDSPAAEDILAVLESANGPIRPPAARDFFYADLCARRNHGCAAIYGLYAGGQLASTAGLWALTAQQGYLANVETCPSQQHRGHASALIGLLCAHHGHRPLSLMCRTHLLPFYARFGFLPIGQSGLVGVYNH